MDNQGALTDGAEAVNAGVGAANIPTSASPVVAGAEATVANQTVSLPAVSMQPVVETTTNSESQLASGAIDSRVPVVSQVPPAVRTVPSAVEGVLVTSPANDGMVAPPAAVSLPVAPLVTPEMAEAVAARPAEPLPATAGNQTPTVAPAVQLSPQPASEFVIPEEHPLHDLYTSMTAQAESADELLVREIEQERRLEEAEELERSQVGWRVTQVVSAMLMMMSWCLLAVSIVYPFVYPKAAANDSAISFTLIVLTIVFLLTGSLLAVWVDVNGVIKKITWFLTLIFALIFLLAWLKAGQRLPWEIPWLDVLLTKLAL